MRIFLLFCLVVIPLCACGNGGKDGQGSAKTGTADAGAVPVEVVEARQGPITDGVEGSATVEARQFATVRAQVAGTISAINVEEGAQVTADQALAQLQRPAFADVVRKARGSRDKAARDVRALSKLAKDGLVPGQQLDEARFALRQANLEVQRLSKESALAEVKSPISGVITARRAQAGEAISVGTPLFDVADVDDLLVHLRLPERHLTRLAVGQPVTLHATGVGGASVPGAVERIAPTVDGRSGTVKVTVAIPDAEVGTGSTLLRLRPGMYVRARIVVDVIKDAVLLPKRAVIYDEDRAFAFRVTDSTAQRIALDLGYADRTHVAVKRDIAAGDQVVVFGQRGLEDGAKVQVVDPTGAPASATPPSATPPSAAPPSAIPVSAPSQETP
ncbi:MAG: membrane fusion protein (multidrug efflux system) [Bradymonadia bacterium]|jgi:membrane fusion protein (multidrug efflux system)